jgi:hypothetical protein
MSTSLEQTNQQLLALTESYANAAVGPAEFRQQRRLLVCQWTGEPVPTAGQGDDSEDHTAPKLKAITDADIAMATWAPTSAAVTVVPLLRRPVFWATLGLILMAVLGAAGLAWFVLR